MSSSVSAAGYDLLEHVGALEMRLLAHATPGGDDGVRMEALQSHAIHRQRFLALEADDPTLPIHGLRSRLGFSPFEEECLWLAVACATDDHVAELVAHCHGDGRNNQPTPWLCLRLFAENRAERLAALGAFDSAGPLFSSGALVYQGSELNYGPMLRPFGAAPFVVAALRGLRRIDNRIERFAKPDRVSISLEQVALTAEDQAAIRAIVTTLRAVTVLPGAEGMVSLVSGQRGCGKTSCVRAIACECGADLIELDGPRLGAISVAEAADVVSIAFSQAAVTGAWLLIDAVDRLFRDPPPDSPFTDQPTLTGVLLHELHRRGVVAWLTADTAEGLSPALRDRLSFHHELRPADRKTSEMVWQVNCPGDVELDVGVDFSLLAQAFPLSGRGIRNALRIATLGARDGVLRQSALVEAASKQHGPGLGVMARRTWVRRSRDDLLLPGPLSMQLDEIIETERIRERVLQDWGLARRIQKGLGILCLFDGEPGTGKTLAAEVIASELALPLYTVSVANVVSKWIGDTEKNLQLIFDEAQKGRCVLLFDEADSLFSKRTEVSRSVDRYANMEISLLLQVVESYPGLVILTTNLKEAIDVAFMRRFAYKLNFPFPDAEIRKAIWERLLPRERLAPDVDIRHLADGFELSGGSIRTAVLRASYRAARGGGLLTASILSDVAMQECKALGRLVREKVK